ncbi:uncharacterized protein A4U43_C03F23840 [Asparagus officinalis]|uniref:Uncharacterized protein n=1 Tax=Asparagus officinalis TaxID=4686 RepID=A0A5P1FFC3_ASPOF|nr:uncharacterized protein A4U43_C03F23840 [Asparagus officinalis]
MAGFHSGFRVLAPTMYIFFASALPVIAFGEQLSKDTEGALRPLTLDIYLKLEDMELDASSEAAAVELYFVKSKVTFGGDQANSAGPSHQEMPSASIISRFTRVAGELFGMLITVLLFQEAIKGLVSEFNVPKGEDLSLMGGFRGFIADYGVPLMVVAWTAISYATPNNVPSGVPRRLFSPLPWDSKSVHHWAVAKARASKPLFS